MQVFDDFVLPKPSLLTVPGLASVLETSEEEGENHRPCVLEHGAGEDSDISEEEEEILNRFNNLRGTTSRSTIMEEPDFLGKVKGLRKMELMIEVMLKEYTLDHVTYEDRESQD